MSDNITNKEVDVTAFEKSFDDSIDTLANLLNGGTKPEAKAEEILKAKKEAKSVDLESDEPEGDDDEDEDDEDDKKKDAKKSLPDMLAEIPEVAEAMDVEPFLREMAKAIDDRFSQIEDGIKVLKKSVQDVNSLAKAQGQLLVNSAALMKATSETVEKIGETPIPSPTLLRKGGDRFPESTDGKRLGRDEILTKAMELRAAGKLSVTDVTKIEGRLNKSMPLDERHLALITGQVQ